MLSQVSKRIHNYRIKESLGPWLSDNCPQLSLSELIRFYRNLDYSIKLVKQGVLPNNHFQVNNIIMSVEKEVADAPLKSILYFKKYGEEWTIILSLRQCLTKPFP